MSDLPRATGLAALVVRRPLAIVVIALILGVLGYFGTRRLGIDQELRALLPDDAPSVTRLDAVSDRLGNQSDLYVTIRGPSREANLALGAAIADDLAGRDDIRYVLFRRDPAFFRDHLLFYAGLQDLLDLRQRVIDAIQTRVRRELSMFPEDRAAGAGDDDLDLDEKALRERYGLDSEPSEYFERDEGRLVVVRARPTRANTDISFARGLSRELKAAIDGLEPRRYHPDIEVTIDGSYAEHTAQASSLERDIISGTAFAFGLLLLVVAIYFRGLRAVPLVLVPLLVAVVTTLAIGWVFYRELNLVSAFIFAVTLGLGIDFGTHILSRYRDERRRGLDQLQAISTTIATTGVSTAGGAMSTAFAFLFLVLAEFRGFSQFGVIGSLGIMIAFVAALVVLPALVLVLDRVVPWRVPAPTASTAPGARYIPRRFPWLALGTVLVCLGGGVYGVTLLPQIGFEYNLSKLGPPDRTSPEEQQRANQYRDAVGRTQSSDPTIVLTDNLAHTEAVNRQLQAILDLEPEQIAEITGLEPYADTPRKPKPEPKPAPAPKPAADEDDEDDEAIEPDDAKFVRLAELARAHGTVDPAVREQLKQYPPERLREMDDLLSSVLSIYTFVPELQAEKLEIIRDIRTRIDNKRGSFSAAELEKLKSWERYLQVDAPIGPEDLPQWVKVQFTDMHGELGRFVACWQRGPKSEYAHAKRIHDAFDTIETPLGPAPAVGSHFVVPEVVDAIRGDGPLVMTAVFGVLTVTALVMFRSVAHAAIVLATVGSALGWLAGVFVAMGWTLNLFNLVALPLLVGMGQDDSLHIIHRFREEGPGRLAHTMRETGGAVALTTVTTVIGFSSMLFVDHIGVRSLGWTAVVGMTFCLLASLTLVPACLRLGEWSRVRRGE
ncbi:efflux RND transporter permease subunit [Nannocystis bainbridge]|uniref:MMPL family transporter n=1 Tax=Nannocystis bainbridge TaxID=2995303 RepID=A0ABT5DZI8_9BACT|nr:MMPL family transporter [Nannocystis bainbridge]MDC0718479.1 MMPL family transporter [Nannocystis bainbridge]